MPQEVLLTPQGDLLVFSVRALALFRVEEDGTVTLLADELYGYQGDVDAQGNVYLSDVAGGRVFRVAPDGTQAIIARSDELRTGCSSGFAVGPDGNLYLARNLCDSGEMERPTSAVSLPRDRSAASPLESPTSSH